MSNSDPRLRNLADQIRSVRLGFVLSVISAFIFGYWLLGRGPFPQQYLLPRIIFCAFFPFCSLVFGGEWVYSAGYLKGWRAAQKSELPEPPALDWPVWPGTGGMTN